MPAGSGDLGPTVEQGKIAGIGGLTSGVRGRGIVEPSEAPEELTDLEAAERDVRRVDRVAERGPGVIVSGDRSEVLLRPGDARGELVSGSLPGRPAGGGLPGRESARCLGGSGGRR
jgi:hypothetical protein